MLNGKDRLLWKNVGRAIREQRQLVGFTQAELARLVGCTRTTITNAENGNQRLGLADLYQIALVLGISAYDLLPSWYPDVDPITVKAVKELAALRLQRRELMDKLAEVTRQAFELRGEVFYIVDNSDVSQDE